jgi:DNA-binding NarL/FixJ family response regulator
MSTKMEISTLCEPLTERELKIVEMASNGLRIIDMAKRLYLSPRTIDDNWANILFKLNCKTMTHAVAILFRQGILK